MSDEWSEEERDFLAIAGILLGFGAGGAFSLAVFGAALQRWLLDVGVFLSGDGIDIPFPWATDIGIDLPRLLIAIGGGLVLMLGIAAAISVVRHRHSVSLLGKGR